MPRPLLPIAGPTARALAAASALLAVSALLLSLASWDLLWRWSFRSDRANGAVSRALPSHQASSAASIDAGQPRVTPRFAYLIQAARSNIGHVPRLLRAIHRPEHTYAVHVDRKATDMPEYAAVLDLVSRAPYRDNVHLMPSTLVTYTGISQILNTIEAIELLLGKSAGWTHFINLSGADYPLIAQEDFAQILRNESLDAQGRPTNVSFIQVWANSPSAKRWHVLASDPALLDLDSDIVVHHSSRNKLVPKLPYLVGPAWVILHRELCESIAGSPEMRRLLLAMASTKVPEEAVFQNFITWTETGRRFAGKVADDCLRYDEPIPGESHTRWLVNASQVERAVSRGAVFARKFTAESSMPDYVDQLQKESREQIMEAVRRRVERAVKLMQGKDG
ncbi:core-2/I-branching enzyme-domain-containing protein [Hyaloraphidium curvatum]|nr:core-2/I-branching enzyme-domain-containing protein [Hyaloraphidium curvatum]